MSAVFSIRAMSDDEWQIFSAVRLEALQDSPQFFGASYAKESQNTPDQWRNWLKPYRQAVFVLFDGEEPIGMTALMTDRNDPETGLCIASYIRPSYRGRGLSEMLYRARIDWAADHTDWQRLVVSHRKGNDASRGANQKWGFAFSKTEMKDWPDGTREDEVIYELDLVALRRQRLEGQPLITTNKIGMNHDAN